MSGNEAIKLWVGILLLGLLAGSGQVMMRVGGRNMALGELMSLHGLAHHAGWWVGLLISWACGLLWAWMLTHVRLASALPVFTGVAYLAAIIGSGICLKESISLRDGLGFALVVSGITLIVKS